MTGWRWNDEWNDVPGLVNIEKAMKKWPIEIVDFPSYKMGGFSSSLCESLPEDNGNI